MYILAGGHGQGLFPVIGGQHPIALGLEIYFQRGDDVLFVVND